VFLLSLSVISRLGSVMTVALHRLSPRFSKLAPESGFPGKQSVQVLLAASALSRCSTIREESCSWVQLHKSTKPATKKHNYSDTSIKTLILNFPFFMPFYPLFLG
jgi:hypothetical protein